MKALFPLILSCWLLAMTSCDHQAAKKEQVYSIGLISFGKTTEATRKAAEKTCRNLLNDSNRRVMIEWLKDTIAMQPAYYQPRKRYRADVLLAAVKKVKKRYDRYDAVLLITDLPVSTTVHDIPDYGICGLSYLKEGASVVSSSKLSNIMFCQVLRHEWAHGIGIPHCEEKGCIMNDAKGKIKNVADHSHFSPECYAYAAKVLR